MCDPLTLAFGAMSLFAGNRGAEPPKAELPATPAKEALDTTGAEVVLGGEDDDEELGLDILDERGNAKRTSGTGLTTSARSGVNIL